MYQSCQIAGCHNEGAGCKSLGLELTELKCSSKFWEGGGSQELMGGPRWEKIFWYNAWTLHRYWLATLEVKLI